MKIVLAALFVFLSSQSAMSAEVICTPALPPRGYEVGVTLQTLLPNELPDFTQGLPIYGPILGASIGRQNLLVRGLYGSVASFSTYIIEAAIRWNVDLHYFHMYALTGGQFMHYSASGNSHQYFGGNLGVGAVIPVSGKYQITVGAKAYILQKPLISFETAFSIFL